MSDKSISLDYDESGRKATLKFPNGRRLVLSNVSRDQADAFVERHGQEFMRRDCVLHTMGGIETRGADHG